jgi:hypothetical protein
MRKTLGLKYMTEQEINAVLLTNVTNTAVRLFGT